MFGLSMLKGGSGGVEPLPGNLAVFLGANSSNKWYSEYFTITSLGNSTAFGSVSMSGSALNYGSVDSGTGNRLVSHVRLSAAEYLVMNTPGDSITFGNMSQSDWYQACGTSNKSNNRGLFAGGVYNGNSTSLRTDYVTMNSPGNSQLFANLISVHRIGSRNISNGESNRGLVCGGNTAGPASNVIEYFTVNTIADAIDFGDLTQLTMSGQGTSNGTNNRGIYCGNPILVRDRIEYFTINSPGNGTVFGNLTNLGNESFEGGSASNATGERALIGEGWQGVGVDYITINSPGNSVAFGDISLTKKSNGVGSNS